MQAASEGGSIRRLASQIHGTPLASESLAVLSHLQEMHTLICGLQRKWTVTRGRLIPSELAYCLFQGLHYSQYKLLECLDHSPACSPHPSMQTAVFLCISCLLASALLIHGSYTHGSHA